MAPTTAKRYEDIIRHIEPFIGSIKLKDLKVHHVERLRNALLSTGKMRGQTVGDVLRVLSQAMRKAVKKGELTTNPADPSLVDRPVGTESPVTVIDEALARRILGAVRDTEPWDVAVHLALGMSLRREEVLGLRWSDVEVGYLRVTNTLTFAAGALHQGGAKTKAGQRELEIPTFVEQALKRQSARQAERRLLLGPAWSPPKDESGAEIALVVDRGDGGFYSPPSFSTGWARFAAQHGFGDVTFHGLRHGAATLMLAAGVPDPVAIKIMGHADTRILRRYQEVVRELKRDAATKMDALLGNA